MGDGAEFSIADRGLLIAGGHTLQGIEQDVTRKKCPEITLTYAAASWLHEMSSSLAKRKSSPN
jgi:hypothetical protein